MTARPSIVALAGPTASGKTTVAVALAERIGGEIVNLDSRQLYRGLTIGSAAPTATELARAPHHLVGCLEPTAETSVAEVRDAAEATLADILARGRQPIVVAGTGLYLSTLVYGWTLTGAPADPALRATLDRLPGETLHERLRAVDPATAARLEPSDRKRLIRALEVYETTGRPFSAHQRETGRRPVPYDYRLIGLSRPRAELYERIDARVEAMLAAGWLNEVQSLLSQGLTGSERALEGLGYRRLIAALRGEITIDEAVRLTKQDTRRLAKRQLTWFRQMDGLTWLEIGSGESPEAVAKRVEALWRR